MIRNVASNMAGSSDPDIVDVTCAVVDGRGSVDRSSHVWPQLRRVLQFSCSMHTYDTQARNEKAASI